MPRAGTARSGKGVRLYVNETRTRTKVIRTTLDSLPYGTYSADTLDPKEKIVLPSGVSRRQLIRDAVIIAWPSLVELLLTQLTSMADQVMVGNIAAEAGKVALSAVSLAAQPKFLLMTMIQALNVGSTAVIARFRGQQNREKTNQVFRQALLLNLIIGAVMALLGTAFAPQLIGFMSGKGIRAETRELAAEYLRIQMYGFVPLVLTFSCTAALRGIGDSRTSMVYNTVANVVNVCGNYVLIYGKFGCPALGVAGASIATVIGQTVAFCIAMAIVLRGRRYIYLSFRERFRFDGELFGNVVSIGVPSMIEQLFMRAGMIVFTRMVSGLGEDYYAAHTVCMNVMSLSFMLGQAFATATTTLMGQSLGKRRYDMAVLYMRQTRLLGMIAATVVGVLLAVFNRGVIEVYNKSPEVIEIGGKVIFIIAAAQPLQALQFIVAGGLRGAGDTRFTAICTAITVFGLRTGLVLLLTGVLGMGLWGAWIAIMADQAVRTVLVMWRYNTGLWARRALKHAEETLSARQARETAEAAGN